MKYHFDTKNDFLISSTIIFIIIIPDLPRPISVDELRCENVGHDSFTVRWDPPWNKAIVTKYQIWIRELGRDYVTIPEDTYLTVTDLDPETDYSIWVGPCQGDDYCPRSLNKVIVCRTTEIST